MSMELHTPEVDFTEERFDFLRGLHGLIRRVDEIHSNELDDSNYTFVIWVKDIDDLDTLVRRIMLNIVELGDVEKVRLYDNETGVIFVTASVV